MFSFWRKYPEINAVLLPQKIMRPFWHPQANTLDNYKFSCNLSYERPLWVCSGILLSAVLCFSLAVFAIWRHWHSSEPKTELDNELILTLLVTLLALTAGGFLIHLFARAVPARYWVLDRSNHRVTVPLPTLLPSYMVDDYAQFQARILHEINLLGRRRTRLVMEHPKSGQQVTVYVTRELADMLVGYWSFIVQYMKPGAALPDVPELHHFPNTTPGIRKQITNNYTL